MFLSFFYKLKHIYNMFWWHEENMLKLWLFLHWDDKHRTTSVTWMCYKLLVLIIDALLTKHTHTHNYPLLPRLWCSSWAEAVHSSQLKLAVQHITHTRRLTYFSSFLTWALSFSREREGSFNVHEVSTTFSQWSSRKASFRVTSYSPSLCADSKQTVSSHALYRNLHDVHKSMLD